MTRIDCNSYEAKYIIFATVIDMLAHMLVKEGVGLQKSHTMTTYEIRDCLHKDKRLSKIIKPYSVEQINQWISELSWMGLITRVSERTENSVISLTEKGLIAYQEQSLHQVAANLLEARESRHLSTVAIGISIVSICITTVFAILNFTYERKTSYLLKQLVPSEYRIGTKQVIEILTK